MEEQKTSKEEQISFHKGALSVLALEQNEFVKILQAVQAQIQAHVNALKELGVDIVAEQKKALEELKKRKEESEGGGSAANPSDDIADRLA